MHKAFLLGAGLGTRLKPLTDTLPKPLLPFENRPLVTHILDRCIAADLTDIAINTHHLPETWQEAFPDGTYKEAKLTFFHEPDLLETGGGLKNIASWIGSDHVLVHNADILTDLPLDRLLAAHTNSHNTATLAVKDHGPALRLAVNGQRVTDIHGKLDGRESTHQFIGVYVVAPGILELIPEHEKISVIPAFLELARQGKLGAYHVEGDPEWIDLGTREAYLEASLSRKPRVAGSAEIAPSAVTENSWIGEGCRVEGNAVIRDSILWPHTVVSNDAELTKCIVHSKSPVAGKHLEADL